MEAALALSWLGFVVLLAAFVLMAFAARKNREAARAYQQMYWELREQVGGPVPEYVKKATRI